MKSLKFALITILALAGSAEAKSLFSNGETDYGAPISQSQCQAMARRAVEPYLRNPSAAKYQWGKCEAQVMRAFPFQKVPKQAGYGMTFKVNSTNQWGKYTGYTEYVVLIHNGQVIRRMREDERGSLVKY